MPGPATAVAFAVAEQPPAYGPGQPRLLDRVRIALRTRHLSRRTEQAYVFWIRRYILSRHPATRSRPTCWRRYSTRDDR